MWVKQRTCWGQWLSLSNVFLFVFLSTPFHSNSLRSRFQPLLLQCPGQFSQSGWSKLVLVWFPWVRKASLPLSENANGDPLTEGDAQFLLHRLPRWQLDAICHPQNCSCPLCSPFHLDPSQWIPRLEHHIVNPKVSMTQVLLLEATSTNSQTLTSGSNIFPAQIMTASPPNKCSVALSLMWALINARLTFQHCVKKKDLKFSFLPSTLAHQAEQQLFIFLHKLFLNVLFFKEGHQRWNLCSGPILLITDQKTTDQKTSRGHEWSSAHCLETASMTLNQLWWSSSLLKPSILAFIMTNARKPFLFFRCSITGSPSNHRCFCPSSCPSFKGPEPCDGNSFIFAGIFEPFVTAWMPLPMHVAKNEVAQGSHVFWSNLLVGTTPMSDCFQIRLQEFLNLVSSALSLPIVNRNVPQKSLMVL